MRTVFDYAALSTRSNVQSVGDISTSVLARTAAAVATVQGLGKISITILTLKLAGWNSKDCLVKF
jgi:hypothetical protein